MSQIPRIVQSPLDAHRWFVVTRYTEQRGTDAETGAETAYLVAQRKYDVTDQMTAILKAHTNRTKRSKRRRKA